MASRVAAMAVLVAAISVSAEAGAQGPSTASSGTPKWDITANQEIRYVSWSGTRGYPGDGATARGSGSQFYAPLSVQAVGIPVESYKVELLARTGYVWSRQSTLGLSGMVSTPTDTIVSGTVTYTGIAGFQPYVSLNANLPTGQTVLKGATANARMDPDIVDIATFGEGWNIGPTIGANFPITDSTTLSFGAGHTVRGPYDKEGLTDPNALVRIDPGDVTTLNASISTESGKFSFEGSASYSWESVTYRLGSPSFKLGDRYLVSGTAGYAWTDASKSIVTASWSANKRNKIINTEINDLITEAFNSNNNVYRARIDHLFTVGGWVVGPTANYMLRDVNSYSPSTLQFVPAKTRWGAGATVKHKLNKQIDLNASIERMWIKESANVGSNIPDLSIDGWAFVVGGVLRY